MQRGKSQRHSNLQAATGRSRSRFQTQPEEIDDLIGAVIMDKYRIIGKLGAGGMGAVYSALDEKGSKIAVKIVMAQWTNKEAAARFFREVKSTLLLKHPNIVRVFDWGPYGDSLFCAMEYLEGDDLSRTLKGRGGRMTWEEAKPILMQICNGLMAAHAKNIIHRDLKPANIFVLKNGRVKILDFGLAKRIGVEDDDGLTKTGDFQGTPAYMAPEQTLGDKKRIGSKTDVYSFGVILYRLLTGDLPFKGKTGQVILDINNKQPQRPREKNPAISLGVEALILRMMEKNPERRPSIVEVGEAIANDGTLGGMPDEEPSDRYEKLPESVWERPEKKSGWLGKLVVGGVIVGALAGGAYYYRDQLMPQVKELIDNSNGKKEERPKLREEKLEKRRVEQPEIEKEFEVLIVTEHRDGVAVYREEGGEKPKVGISTPQKPLKVMVNVGDVLFFRKRGFEQKRVEIEGGIKRLEIKLEASKRLRRQ